MLNLIFPLLTKDTFIICDIKVNSAYDYSFTARGYSKLLNCLIMGTDNFLVFDTSVTMAHWAPMAIPYLKQQSAVFGGYTTNETQTCAH